MLRLIPLAVLVALAFGCRTTDDMKSADMVANATCPMSGNPVDESAYLEYEGTKIYACCPKCIGAMEKDPAAAFAKAYPKK